MPSSLLKCPQLKTSVNWLFLEAHAFLAVMDFVSSIPKWLFVIEKRSEPNYSRVTTPVSIVVGNFLRICGLFKQIVFRNDDTVAVCIDPNPCFYFYSSYFDGPSDLTQSALFTFSWMSIQCFHSDRHIFDNC